MCRIYLGVTASSYEPVTRSLRLNGPVTSIRLEARFWAILDEMAAAEGVTTPRFVATLHDEVLELRGEVRNFASLLRVACTVYLERRAADGPAAAPKAATRGSSELIPVPA